MNQTVIKGIIMTWLLTIATFAVLHLLIIEYAKNLKNKISSQSVFLNHPLYRLLRYNLMGLTLVYMAVFTGMLITHQLMTTLALVPFILITLFNLLELLILSCNVRKEVNLFYMSPFINTLIGAVMYLWII